MPSKPLLAVHEAAGIPKAREIAARAWIDDRDPRAIEFGREWRVSQAEPEVYPNERANRPPTARDRSAGRRVRLRAAE